MSVVRGATDSIDAAARDARDRARGRRTAILSVRPFTTHSTRLAAVEAHVEVAPVRPR